MRLLEVKDELQIAHSDVLHFIQFYERFKTTHQSIETLMRKPEYKYTGEMFRVHMIDPRTIAQASKASEIPHKVKPSADFLSWSKNTHQLEHAIRENIDSDLYGHHLFPAGIVYRQVGVGLDAWSVVKDMEELQGRQRALLEDEQEVLAKIQSPAVYGFWANGVTRDFNEFIAFVHDGLEEHDYDDGY